MGEAKTILVLGTFDTKGDELAFLADRIRGAGGDVLTMDVGVLGTPSAAPAIGREAVAAAAGTTVAAIRDLGGEDAAMRVMAAGASRLVADLHAAGRIDGLIAVGGTMGTDLALDCAAVLPVGVPKYVVSTVAFSPLLPADRLAPDLQMILWAGGLYGLNALSRSVLAQAAGAVLGAARTAEPPRSDRPTVGMTSLGASCLSYMTALKPALEARGFSVAIFHATGMGGRAFEHFAREGAFVAVLDFALPEIGNHMAGSLAGAGPQRLTGAGAAGVPQIVAPGCIDLVDFAGWQDLPPAWRERPVHSHNRLIKSSALSAGERRETARILADRLAGARAPVHVLLPLHGLEAWDRPGGAAHDPAGLAAFVDAMRQAVRPPLRLTEVDAHINDAGFVAAALAVVDAWLADGTIAAPS